MRIAEIRERSVPISRYADATIPSGGLTTSIVAATSDVVREGKPVVGYGFASVGHFAQGGLMRERFIPRLLNASGGALADDVGMNLDPFRAWETMMAGEKPGGHGERCVAVGALDMAIWDAAAKIAELPLYRYMARRLGREATIEAGAKVRVYGAGGYLYPEDDIARLSAEVQRYTELGFTHAKIKIGGAGLPQDQKRIEAAAMLGPFGLWWFEDICDPLDFETQASVAHYSDPVAAGEALFSLAEAKLLNLHGGLRRERDILEFDPVHCYGLPGFVQIVDYLTGKGWPRSSFWPHGGHLFCLHLVSALGLGGAEVNPFSFQPLCGLIDGAEVVDGFSDLPQAPGIGFELRSETYRSFRSLAASA